MLLFNGYKVSVLQDEEFWRLKNSVNVLNTTELYTQEWLRWYISCYVYFTRIKKKHQCPGVISAAGTDRD